VWILPLPDYRATRQNGILFACIEINEEMKNRDFDMIFEGLLRTPKGAVKISKKKI
jgi:hypothetical protein